MNISRIVNARTLTLSMILLLAAGLLVLMPGAGDQAVGWAESSGGMGNADNVHIYSMTAYESRLYVGTSNNISGCEVWSTDGTVWINETSTVGGGFGNPANVTAMSMTVYMSRLFVGTMNFNGCEVWSTDGISWTQEVGGGPAGSITAPGFGNSNNLGAESLGVYADSVLLAGTFNNSGCEVCGYNGALWFPMVGSAAGSLLGPGFGDINNGRVVTMTSYRGMLCAGVSNNATGCEVWNYNGIAWLQQVGNLPGSTTPSGFGDTNNTEILSMAVFQDRLCAGTNNGANGCQVWSTPDMINWTQDVGGGAAGTPQGPGFGDTGNTMARSMLVYDSRLYVGTSNNLGCQMWSFSNGTNWEESVGPSLTGSYATGFGDTNNIEVACLGMLNSRILAGTCNYATGGVVVFDRFSTTWYLAEGATAGGYETWVLIQNPGTDPVAVDIRYLTGSGEVVGPIDVVPAESRRSYLVNSTVQTFDVSTVVYASGNVVCERAVYWTPEGSSTKEVGHDSVGVTNPAFTWYLAEGATAGGYETWVLVQNPNNAPVTVNIGYYTDSGYVIGPLAEIPARSRQSFLVNDTVQTYNVSTAVWGTDRIICERAVYWTPEGGAHKVLGTDCIGTTATSRIWYMAEGATTGGYETWVLVQNPGTDPVDVDIRYQTGTGEVHGPADTIPGESRRSYKVNETVETYDVSMAVYASAAVICERSMYWTPEGGSRKVLGHDSVGVTAPWNEWYLAEGSTAGGYETWVLVQNPGTAPVDIGIDYQTATGSVPGPTAAIPAEARMSFLVNDTVETFDVSTHVYVIGTGYVICERAVYWTPDGASRKVLGTNSIGWPDL